MVTAIRWSDLAYMVAAALLRAARLVKWLFGAAH